MSFSRLASLVPVLALLAAPTAASDLTVDGVNDLDVPVGGSFVVDLSGNPGLTALVYLDVSPGPTILGGESIPLGLTPALSLFLLGTTGASGSFSTPWFLPNDPSLANVTVYIAGAILDPADPNGVDVSNGCSLHFVPKVGAGADSSTLVGRDVVADGSGALDPDGTLPQGVALSWQLVAQPPGSGAVLTDATGPFPTFVPDLPGDYTLELTATQSGAVSKDQCVVHAYRVDYATAIDGTYVFGPGSNVSGTVVGPDVPGTTLSIDGQPMPLDGAGGFGPYYGSFASGAILRGYELELTNPDGSAVRDRISIAQGIPLPLSFPSVQGLNAHLNQGGLDELAIAAETELLNADLAGSLLAIPPTTVADTTDIFGFTWFSATVTFTGVAFDQTNADLSLTPQTGSLAGLATLYGIDVDYVVTGEILEIGYSLPGDMSASSADLSATLTASASGGALAVVASNPSVTLNGFDYDLDGFFGSVAELLIITDWVQDTVEDAVESEVCNQLGPAIQEILGAYVLSGNLFETLEVDVTVSTPFAKVATTPNGVTVRLDGTVSVDSSEPGSPVVGSYRSTITGAPSFGTTTPVGGQAYDAGLSVADDFLNQVLAASTGAGLLDGDMAELFATDPTTSQTFTTDVLDALFPSAGFGHFPAGTPVDLIAHGTLPPIVRTTPGGTSLGEVDMNDLEIRFQVADAGGPKTLMVVSLDANAELDLTVGAGGALTATLGTSTVDASVMQGFPGSDLTILSAGVSFLATILVPQLSTLFGGIPLPSLEAEGLSINPTEIGLTGGANEHVGFYGDLTLVPLP